MVVDVLRLAVLTLVLETALVFVDVDVLLVTVLMPVIET